MAATRKRKSQAGGIEEATKRLRIDQMSAADFHENNDDDDDEDYHSHVSGDSEEEKAVDTPNTPLSPARKKFPSELKTIKCTFPGCTKTFNRPVRLTAHMRTHNNERPYVCDREGCDKSYFEDKHLQQHIKGSHTHERTFHCDWEGCGKSFLTSTRLNRHKDTHIGHERFRCTAYPPCNQTFRKHQTLQRHVRSDHLHLAPYPCTFVDPVTQLVCNAGFDGATGLRKHVDRVHGDHEPQFPCADCDVPGFKTQAQLTTHIRKEHAHCMFCDLKCTSQRVLLQHIESQHSGNTLEERKKVLCPYEGCGKRFTKQNNLNTHIRSVHLGERFICGNFDVDDCPDVAHFDISNGCGNDFVSKASLVDHIRTAHLGLASVVNGNRPRRHDELDDFMDEDELRDPDDDYVPSKKATRKFKKRKPTATEELLGMSYAADPDRNIPCQMFGCPYMFIREYDLQVHMRSAHPYVDHSYDPAPAGFENNYQYPDPGTMMSGMEPQYPDNMTPMQPEMNYGKPDIDWELQRQALEGGPFWVGAQDENGPFQSQDEWNQEQLEMQRLIG